MKPPPFDYVCPETLDEATALLARPEADVVVLAGGQSLMPLLNLRLAFPDQLLDINRIVGLDTIEIDERRVRIGALTRLETVRRHAELGRSLPALVDASGFVAHPQIRVRSTIGGTLCHADPTAEIPVVAVALDADIELASVSGRRVISAQTFFRSVFETAKEGDELVVAAEFSTLPGFEFAFGEVSRRSHGDFPYVSLCAGVRQVDGEVLEARLGAGGVADRPIRMANGEQALIGRHLSESLTECARTASSEVQPSSDIHGSADFRRSLLRALITRTLTSIAERTAIA